MRGDEIAENSPGPWLAMKWEGKRLKWALEGMEAESRALQNTGSAIGKASVLLHKPAPVLLCRGTAPAASHTSQRLISPA